MFALPRVSEKVFLVALGLIGVGLGCSRSLMSWGTLLLASITIVKIVKESNLKEVLRPTPLRMILILYAFLFLSLFYSSDVSYGVRDLRIKLTMIAIPPAIWLFKDIFFKNFHKIMHFYCIVTALLSLYYILFHDASSPFISHIRLTLWCLALSVYMIFGPPWRDLWLNIVRWLSFVTIMAFVVMAGRGTFIAAVIVSWLTYCLVWKTSRKSQKKIKRVLGLGFVVFSGVVAGLFYYLQYRDAIPSHALSPDIYSHYGGCHKENGYRVWDWIHWGSARREWNRRSIIPFDSIHNYLFRYLASKGLAKDSAGIAALSPEEIKAIEKGATNYLLAGMPRLFHQAYNMLQGLYLFICGREDISNSLYQRLVHLSTGLKVAWKYLPAGTGVGDVQLAFDIEYALSGIKPGSPLHKRAHNQFLTMIITIGIPGLLFIAIMVYPAIREEIRSSPIFISWWSFLITGAMVDDIIETQDGATLFAVLYAFITMFSMKKGMKKECSGHQ